MVSLSVRFMGVLLPNAFDFPFPLSVLFVSLSLACVCSCFQVRSFISYVSLCHTFSPSLSPSPHIPIPSALRLPPLSVPLSRGFPISLSHLLEVKSDGRAPRQPRLCQARDEGDLRQPRTAGHGQVGVVERLRCVSGVVGDRRAAVGARRSCGVAAARVDPRLQLAHGAAAPGAGCALWCRRSCCAFLAHTLPRVFAASTRQRGLLARGRGVEQQEAFVTIDTFALAMVFVQVSFVLVSCS